MPLIHIIMLFNIFSNILHILDIYVIAYSALYFIYNTRNMITCIMHEAYAPD